MGRAWSDRFGTPWSDGSCSTRWRIAPRSCIAQEELRAAKEAGCDDLITCAASPKCPLPFADLAHDAATTRFERHNGDAS